MIEGGAEEGRERCVEKDEEKRVVHSNRQTREGEFGRGGGGGEYCYIAYARERHEGWEICGD